MDYKGKKVWLFHYIPLVYNTNDTEWAVDVQNAAGNWLLDKMAIFLLTTCVALEIPVIVSPRVDKKSVKKRSAYNESSRHRLTGF